MMDETESHWRGAAEDFLEVKRLRLKDRGKQEAVQNPRQVENIFKNRQGDHRKLRLRSCKDIEDLVSKQIEETQVETSSSSSRVGGDVEC